MKRDTLCFATIPILLLVHSAAGGVVVGTPPGGFATVQDGQTLGIDVNGDGSTDLQISNITVLEGGFSSSIFAKLPVGWGVYRASFGGDTAAAMNLGDQVGPYDPNSFVYAESGIYSSMYAEIVGQPLGALGSAPGGDPRWTDGALVTTGTHHFMGIDLWMGSDHEYGWVEMSVQHANALNPNLYNVTVYDWAFETQLNQPVVIPEPSSFLMLATTVLIFRGRRNRTV